MLALLEILGNILLAGIPWLFNMVCKALGIHDKTKKALIASVILNGILAIPAGCFIWTFGQKMYYNWKNNRPPQMSLPAADFRLGPSDRRDPTGLEHDHGVPTGRPTRGR